MKCITILFRLYWHKLNSHNCVVTRIFSTSEIEKSLKRASLSRGNGVSPKAQTTRSGSDDDVLRDEGDRAGADEGGVCVGNGEEARLWGKGGYLGGKGGYLGGEGRDEGDRAEADEGSVCVGHCKEASLGGKGGYFIIRNRVEFVSSP